MICHFLSLSPCAERLWLPLGPVLGGCPDGGVLLHGSAVVRSCYRHLHRTHRLSEDGERVQRPWRAAAVPRSEVRASCLCLCESFSTVTCILNNVLWFFICREQRLTGILVFVLTGLSVFLAPVLQVNHGHMPLFPFWFTSPVMLYFNCCSV